MKNKIAKELVYEVDQESVSFDALMELIKENPSMMTKAENIMWTLPLGFAEYNENGKVVTYYVLIDDTNKYFCIQTNEVIHAEKLIETDGLRPNYNQDTHDMMIGLLQDQQSKEENVKSPDFSTTKIKSDLFTFNEKVGEMIIFRKGSIVPKSYLDGCLLCLEGDRKSEMEKDMFIEILANALSKK